MNNSFQQGGGGGGGEGGGEGLTAPSKTSPVSATDFAYASTVFYISLLILSI